MKAITALYLASAREFLRDRSAVLFVLLLPVAFAAFFGMLFGGGNASALPGGPAPSVAGAAAVPPAALASSAAQKAAKFPSIEFYLPGLLGIALLWLGIFGTAAPLVEQRQSQLLRRLRVTAISTRHLLVSQIGWRLTVGLLQTILFLMVGRFAFGVGVSGNPVAFAGTVILGALMFISVGYFLAGLAASSEAVVALGQLVNFPMMFLSGSFVPVDSLPGVFKPVAAFLPLTRLNDALRQTMVSAAPVDPPWLDAAILAGWLVVLLALSARLWRWE